MKENINEDLVKELWLKFEANWNSLSKIQQENLMALEAEYEEYDYSDGEIRLRRIK